MLRSSSKARNPRKNGNYLTKCHRVEKKATFHLAEKETLIDFFSANPALWNHHLSEYRDRNLRDSLFDRIAEKFEGKFTKDDLKREWHNLQTIYKRERAREVGSKTSGAGTQELYISSWEHFANMEFLDVTGDIDVSYTDAISRPPAKKVKTKQTIEDESKAELWRALAASLKPTQPQQVKTPTDETSERAGLFGKVVADSLMQYDISDWSYLKKRKLWTFSSTSINKKSTIAARIFKAHLCSKINYKLSILCRDNL